MTATELVGEAFKYLNAFKRARAIENLDREKGAYDAAARRKLEQYELVDKLELSLRAIQKEIREEGSSAPKVALRSVTAKSVPVVGGSEAE